MKKLRKAEKTTAINRKKIVRRDETSLKSSCKRWVAVSSPGVFGLREGNGYHGYQGVTFRKSENACKVVELIFSPSSRQLFKLEVENISTPDRSTRNLFFRVCLCHY